ncbi:MAG TPA: ATP-binding protein [Ktedonobacteraceae bacterium]|jgi:signal transduction histidine kinase|nr:ATP-binding protein [Ktedonobacteraceae bacterium]
MVEIHQHDLSPLLNSFHEGICYLDTNGALIYHNEAAERHWNLKHASGNRLAKQAAVARALAGTQVQQEIVHVSEKLFLLINSVPLHSASNAIKGVVITSYDVSDHLLEELQALTALNILLEVMLDTYGENENNEIDEVLRRIAILIPQMESVDNSVAFRLDDKTGKIVPIGLFGSSQQSKEEWHKELEELTIDLQQALDRSSPPYLQTLRLARPLMFDFASSPALSNPRQLRAAIYAPVMFNGHPLAVLGVERHRPLGQDPTYFPQWTVDMLTALARFASMTIEKNHLLLALNRQYGELETARALLNQRDEFISLTAHELKNPLTAIRGQAQVLRRYFRRMMHPGIANAEATNDLIRGLDSIEHQSRRIEHMINTLLDVSRLDLDRLESDLQEIDLVQLARRALAEQLPYAARNHELHLFANGNPVPIVPAVPESAHSAHSLKIEADEQQLEQILANLLSNAIKYSPEDGPIIVSIRQVDNEYIEIDVEDEGIGIPPEAQAHLTKRFFRAENAMSVDSKGLGLGLYLVNALVAKHGGTLTIKSEGIPGKGSTFTVRLPAHQQ